jgi:hypothetical protein
MTSIIERISSGIYENAVEQHREEHQNLARWAAMLQFRETIAGLREAIDARHAYSQERLIRKAA